MLLFGQNRRTRDLARVCAVAMLWPTIWAQSKGASEIVRDGPTYSACDVLRDTDRYEGRWIRVRGILVSGGGHPAELAAKNCPSPLDTGPFEPMIALSYPTQSFLRDPVPGLVVDSARLAKFWESVRALRRENSSTDIMATFCGVFQARGARVFTFPKAKPRVYGYGHLSAARAQLILEFADDAAHVTR